MANTLQREERKKNQILQMRNELLSAGGKTSDSIATTLLSLYPNIGREFLPRFEVEIFWPLYSDDNFTL